MNHRFVRVAEKRPLQDAPPEQRLLRWALGDLDVFVLWRSRCRAAGSRWTHAPECHRGRSPVASTQRSGRGGRVAEAWIRRCWRSLRPTKRRPGPRPENHGGKGEAACRPAGRSVNGTICYRQIEVRRGAVGRHCLHWCARGVKQHHARGRMCSGCLGGFHGCRASYVRRRAHAMRECAVLATA